MGLIFDSTGLDGSRTDLAAAAWVDRAPDRPALVESSGAWSYRALDLALNEAASWLVAHEMRPGDRLMIVAENCRALVALLLAAGRLNIWPVVVSARLSGREIDAIRAHCGARRILYTTSVSAHARAHASAHAAATQEIGSLGPLGVGATDPAAVPEPVEADPARQVAALIYTSGTTGLPKGVMLTHRNLMFMARMSGSIRSLGPDDRMYGVLPFSHIVGLSVLALGTLLHGAALHMTARFDPAATLAALERDRLTVMLGVPAMYALLIDYARHKGITRIQAPALRVISVSGAPLDPAIKHATEALFGLNLQHGYGVTETSPTIAQTRVEAPRADCSVGPLLPGVEARLVSPGDPARTVPPGEVGELRVRGPNVMKGYYRAPEETAAVLDGDGWFNTRDLARFEGDNLFIVGRTRELIIRFGFNVYPPEIEAVLNSHPAVVQSAVVGRSVEGTEEIVAFVRLTPGADAGPAALAAHAAQHLVAYKRPSEIVVIEEMPATSTGKILKHELARMAAARAAGRAG